MAVPDRGRLGQRAARLGDLDDGRRGAARPGGCPGRCPDHGRGRTRRERLLDEAAAVGAPAREREECFARPDGPRVVAETRDRDVD